MCDKNKAGILQRSPVFVQKKKKEKKKTCAGHLLWPTGSGMSNEGLTFQEGRDGIVIREVLHVQSFLSLRCFFSSTTTPHPPNPLALLFKHGN